MPTNYIFKNLSGSFIKLPPGVTSSQLDLNRSISATILVRSRPSDISLTDYAHGVISGEYATLTRSEFKNTYGASSDDIKTVEEFVNAYGIVITKSYRSSGSINISGPVSAFNSAFNVILLNVITSEREYISYEGTLNVPEEFIEIIYGIVGLDETLELNFQARVTPYADLTANTIRDLTPIEVATAYNFPNHTGAGQCIAIMEFGGGYTTENLTSTFALYGISPPTIVDVLYNGAINDSTNDASIEVMLDISVIGGIAPAAKQVIYFAPNNISNFISAVNAAIHDSTNNPSVISISWGANETVWGAFGIWYMGTILQSAIALGITICVSTGDYGAKATLTADDYTVNYPASSPYVLSCGGTTLEINNGSILSETTWNGSGGGVSTSAFISNPSYQSGLTSKTYPANVVSLLPNRGIPDVSGNGDGNTGYLFYAKNINQLYLGGGTSAVAPLYAGLIARINALKGSNVGFINSAIYSGGGIFNDITVGNNASHSSVGYSATVGWDACTGLGSPNGVALSNYLINGITYTVIPSKSSVNEGEIVVFNVTTTGIANDTTLYWTINNSTSNNADFVSVSGSFTITAQSGNFSVSLINDLLTEGPESFSVSVRLDSIAGTVVATSTAVSINDTSVTPITYAISTDKTLVNEGDTILCTVTTTGISDGTPLYWSINNNTSVSADFAASEGTFTISSNSGTFPINLVNDLLTEGSESFFVTIKTGSISGLVVATSTELSINDTSITPITYAIVSNKISVNEGETVIYTVTTTGMANGSILYWTNNGTTTGTDFSDGLNSSSFSIFSNSAVISRILVTDETTEGSETIVIQLRTESINGPVVAVANSVTVIDSSLTIVPVTHLPTWITPAGFLGTITENITTSLQVLSTGTDITYSILSGELPYGISFNTSTGFLDGTPQSVYQLTNNQFVVRVSNAAGVSDRTFTIDVTGPTPPTWVVANPILGFTGLRADQTEPCVINRQYIDFQLTATTDILPPGKQLYYYIGDNDGELPPGITLSDTGRIYGYVMDNTNIDYSYSVTALYDSDPYSLNPYDYSSINSGETGSNYYNKIYNFRVSVTDSIATSTHLFKINVKDPAYLTYIPSRVPSGQLVSYATGNPVPVQWLINKNLGTLRSNNKYVFELKVYDPYPGYGPVTYTTSTALPQYFSFTPHPNGNSAIIYADLPYNSEFKTEYGFTMNATKQYSLYGTTTSTTATFSLTVIGDDSRDISFITSSTVGTIRPGDISMLSFNIARSDGFTTTYRKLAGELPPGLILETDGSIVGKVQYTASTTTIYSFNVRAEDVQRSTYIDGTFNINVDRSDTIQYTNIFLKPFFNDSHRDQYNDLLSNTDIFNPGLIYRPLDLNFGVQREIRLPLYYGIEQTNLADYSAIMEQYFYNKQLFFGDLNVAYAKTRDNAVLYEVVYVTLVDDLVNNDNVSAASAVTSFNNVLYPNSINNMRLALESIQINSRHIQIDESYTPLYQRTVQDSSGNTLQFVNAAPICYTVPGAGAIILKKLKNSSFNFSIFNFEADRIVVENATDFDSPKYIIFPRK